MAPEVIFHPEASADIREIAFRYAEVSKRVHDRFWEELEAAIKRIGEYPERHHFDRSGLRRFNLKRYPYHILFEHDVSDVRVIVVRFNGRESSYGLDRR